MKADFLQWYQAVSLSLDTHLAEARWEAILTASESLSDAELESLVRAAFRSDQTTTHSGLVRTKLAGSDIAVKDEEFTLLAAAAVAAILRLKLPAAARVATMVETANLKGLRKLSQPMDLIGMGASARLAQGLASRMRPPLDSSKNPALDLDTIDPDKLDADLDVDDLATAVRALLRNLEERQIDFEWRASRYIRQQDEELDMLWWLQGGRTKTGVAFVDVPQEHKPFVFARDLAEITFALPGAPAIGSLLSRAGLADENSLVLAEVIQAMPIEWLKEAIPESSREKVSPVTTPLHEGIKRRLEVRGESTWIPGWAGVCQLEDSASLAPLDLADVFYCEQLLIRM